ncbi:MAG: hypothetical protein K0Q49_285 [Haloplasmataceae bacterium]|jgi:predicted RNA-binding protein (virulence factor B family)|nr:hypothetical protein [Haloplasmataceae bacterium]
MEAGKFVTLKVVRESDLGYILSNGIKEEELLVHYNDAEGRKLQPDDVVNAFLFFDHKGRLTATLQTPKISAFDCDWVEVVEVTRYGVFCNIGIRKDILLSSDDLPLNKELWPIVGDQVYAYIINDNDKALLIKLATKDDFKEIAKEAPKEVYGKKLNARIVKLGRSGANIITDEGYLGFIHYTEYKEEPRLASKVLGRIINVKDNEVNMSLLPQKEIAIKDDRQLILDYLEKQNGKMTLTDKSTPEEIDDAFGISKAAFKRALGTLIRESKVTQSSDKKIVHLNNDLKES